MKKNPFLVALAATFVFAQGVYAEDINAIFKKVNDLVTAQNYSKALEELKWASKEIEKMNGEKIKTFFPDTAAGFTGDKANASSALGFSNIEKNYKGANGTVKLTLTNMGSNGSPLGGLAQLGQMAAMFGGTNGIETFRIQGRTANLDTTSSEPKLTVYLESGSILQFDASGKTSADELKAMAEALKLDELDKYLKGA